MTLVKRCLVTVVSVRQTQGRRKWHVDVPEGRGTVAAVGSLSLARFVCHFIHDSTGSLDHASSICLARPLLSLSFAFSSLVSSLLLLQGRIEAAQGCSGRRRSVNPLQDTGMMPDVMITGRMLIDVRCQIVSSASDRFSRSVSSFEHKGARISRVDPDSFLSIYLTVLSSPYLLLSSSLFSSPSSFLCPFLVPSLPLVLVSPCTLRVLYGIRFAEADIHNGFAVVR